VIGDFLCDCLHLESLEVLVSIEACKEDCVVLWRSDCEGYCAHLKAAKRKSSKARHEGRYGPTGSGARVCGKHSMWESVTYKSH
jgi:hypothetical protein